MLSGLELDRPSSYTKERTGDGRKKHDEDGPIPLDFPARHPDLLVSTHSTSA
jgi:hypothetical protein